MIRFLIITLMLFSFPAYAAGDGGRAREAVYADFNRAGGVYYMYQFIICTDYISFKGNSL